MEVIISCILNRYEKHIPPKKKFLSFLSGKKWSTFYQDYSFTKEPFSPILPRRALSNQKHDVHSFHRVHNELLLLHEFQSWHGKAFILKRSLHSALFQSVNKLFVAATFAFAKDISYTFN